ncbi:MAG: RING finger domain-containing protein [Candidatus Heimdallarchaeota archaeon]
MFTGEIKGKSCAICKLKMQKGQEVLCCPQCNYLFHKEHMMEWLKISSYCPVCDTDFSKIIKKYKELLHREKIDQLIRNQQHHYELFFRNRNLFSGSSAIKITFIVFGIILGFVPVIALPFLTPFPQSIYFQAFSIIFSWMGLTMLALGINGFKKIIDNSWKEMYLYKEKIAITSDFFDDLDINSEDIIRINLLRVQSSGRYSPLQYFITLQVYTLKNKAYHFGKIYQTDSEITNMATLQQLKRKISNLYQIKVQEPKINFVYFIKRFKKHILYSTLIHVLLSIICGLISYFVI